MHFSIIFLIICTVLVLSFSVFTTNMNASFGILNSDSINQSKILFKNATIFDGKNETLLVGMDVLVTDNIISKIDKSLKINSTNATIIDSTGMTLMPGMIDAHSHLSISDHIGHMENAMTWEDLAIRSTINAKNWLMNGITTVRDVGGPVFGLQRAIDSGYIEGPRIYPSGAFLTQTAGHGDLRDLSDRNPILTGHHDSQLERLGFYIIADGRDMVLTAARQNLMQGASQIKIMAAGGLLSQHDPIDSRQYTLDEMKAAVEAASDYGTYVTAHIFKPDAINRAIEAGLKSLEHAFMIDEPTMQSVVENDIIISAQMNIISPEFLNTPNLSPTSIQKIIQSQEKTKDFVPLVKKYNPKIVFGVDATGTPEDNEKLLQYELYYRSSLFGNFETLRQATSAAGEILAMSGLKNPYPDAKLGVIEEGAYADILLIDGNPLEDITLLGAFDKMIYEGAAEPAETIKLIMKDGKIFKNTISQ
ncbi:MAG: amidohydrolase family protein [Nitrososphaeraceae archaeon]